MSISLGRHEVAGIGLQTVKGTKVAAQYWMHVSDPVSNGMEKVTTDPNTSALGVSAETSQGITVSKFWSEPMLKGYVDIDSIGLLEYLGNEEYAVAANADASGLVYDHTYKLGTTSYPINYATIALEDAKTKGDEDIVDAILDTLKVTLGMSTRVGYEAGFVGIYPASGANTSSFNDPVFFGAQNITVKITTGATRVADLAGASAAAVKSGSFDRIYKVLKDDKAFTFNGTGNISDHHQTSKSSSITLEKFMTDNTWRDYEKNGTSIAVQITIEGNTVLTGATTAKPKIVYTFPSCSVARVSAGGANEDRTETLTITPNYGVDDAESASYMVKTVVTNLVADYE